MLRGAVFDSTGAYRYHLWREWDHALPTVTFVMLNPSTADADEDDPTIRRCIGFARAWGFGRLDVMNLFAYRATSPKALALEPAPAGPENVCWLRRAAEANHLVLAWGNDALRLHHRDSAALVEDRRKHSWCLGRTVRGQPRHPLYVPARTSPVPMSGAPRVSERAVTNERPLSGPFSLAAGAMMNGVPGEPRALARGRSVLRPRIWPACPVC